MKNSNKGVYETTFVEIVSTSNKCTKLITFKTRFECDISKVSKDTIRNTQYCGIQLRNHK